MDDYNENKNLPRTPPPSPSPSLPPPPPPLPPQDKYYLVYIAMLIFGFGALTPWNMFITAKDYFVNVKLRNEPRFANNFHTYVGVASQVPNVLFNWMNIFVKIGGGLKLRIIVSLIVVSAMFFVILLLCILDTSNWTTIFFVITILALVIMQSFNAIFMNSVYGMAAILPDNYPGGVVLGSQIAGTVVVFLAWATDCVGTQTTAAVYYFVTGNIVMLICLLTFFGLLINEFFISHHTPSTEAVLKPVSGINNVPYLLVMRQASMQLYNLYIIFFVTLAVFPNIYSDIRPSNPNTFLKGDFTRVTCFLTFNVFATVGSITASVWKTPDRDSLVYFTSFRLVFIPLFMFCNYHPVGTIRTRPVYIKSDLIYWILGVLFSWSSGHGFTLGVIYVRGCHEDASHSTLAGMFGSAIMVTGILSGILFSSVLQKLV